MPSNGNHLTSLLSFPVASQTATEAQDTDLRPEFEQIFMYFSTPADALYSGFVMCAGCGSTVQQLCRCLGNRHPQDLQCFRAGIRGYPYLLLMVIQDVVYCHCWNVATTVR